MPRHENPGNFDPDAKKQVISTATKKQINATEIKSFWTTYTTTKSISFHTGTKSTSKSRTEIKSIWTIHTKFKLVCMLTLQTSGFDPAFKTQVNFDHPNKYPTNFMPHWNLINFDPRQWNQVHLDHPQKNKANLHAYPKNKWFSADIQVTSQFVPPDCQINFIPTLKSSQVWYPTLRSSQFRRSRTPSQFQCPRWKQVIYDPYTKPRWSLAPPQKSCQFWS